MNHCVRLTLLVLCLLSISTSVAPSQPLATPWSVVSKAHNPFRNPLAWSTPRGTTVFANSGGVYVSEDTCNTFASTISSLDILSIEDLDVVVSNGNEVMILNGFDQAQIAGPRMMRSTDAGKTWSFLEGDVVPNAKSGNLLFYSALDARFEHWFSTNAGASWVAVPVPDSLSDGSPNPSRTRLLRHGEFICRFSAGQAWYEADLTSKTWVRRDDLPYKYEAIVRQEDGTLVAWFRNGRWDGIGKQKPGESTWTDLAKVGTVTGVTVDSIDVDELITVDGRYAVVIDRNGRFIRFDGSMCRVVDIGPLNRDSGSLNYDFHERYRVFGNCQDERIEYDAQSHVVRRIPRIEANHYGLSNGQVIATSKSSRLYRYSDDEEAWLRTGQMFRDSQIQDVDPFYDVWVTNTRVYVTDSNRGLYMTTHEDSRLRVVTTAFDSFDVKIVPGVPSVDARLGRGWMWYDYDGVVTGGTRLRRWTPGERGKPWVMDTVLPFSLTAYRGKNEKTGRRYAGYRGIWKGVNDSTWVLHRIDVNGQPDSLRGAISSVIEPLDGAMFAGRRGYDVVVNSTELTSVIHGGMVRTTNSGFTWQTIELPVDDNYICAIEMHPDGTMWATSTLATYHVSKNDADSIIGASMEQDDAHLLRSDDNGITWTVVLTVPSSGLFSPSTRSISIRDELMAVTFPDRVMVSTDYGNTWSAVAGIPNGSMNAARYDEDGNLWIASGEGLWTVRAGSMTGVPPSSAKAWTYEIFQEAEYIIVDISHRSKPDGARVYLVDLLGRSVPVQTEMYGSQLRCKLAITAGMYLLCLELAKETISIPVLLTH